MSKEGLVRMANNCGANIPTRLINKLDSFDNEEDLKKFGADYIASLVSALIDKGAPGIHFYTINQLNPTNQIINLID
jgi:methylenetetrahydrofolate reductase (NADPH)